MKPKEIIEVVRAFEAGKTIQMKCKNYGGDWNEVEMPSWNFWEYDYRVKPEPNIRPYASPLEFADAQKKHGPYLKNKNGKVYYTATKIHEVGVKFDDDYAGYLPFRLIFAKYVWQDGTPCGIIEE